MDRIKKDSSAIGVWAFGLFCLLALLSYHPQDPSFNSSNLSHQIQNWCGYVGSFMADSLFQVLGLSAFFVPYTLYRLGMGVFREKDPGLKNLRWLWGILIVFFISSLLATHFSKTRLFDNQIMMGGILGFALSQSFIKAFNVVGALILQWSCLTVLAVFFSEKTLEELTQLPRAFASWGFKNTGTALKKDWSSFLAQFTANYTAKFKKKEKTPSQVRLEQIKTDEKKAAADLNGDSAEENDKNVKSFLSSLKSLGASKAAPAILKNQSDEADEEDASEKPTPVQLNFKNEASLFGNQALAGGEKRKVVMKARVPQKIENWELPKLSLIEDPPMTRFKIEEKEIRRKADILTDKLNQFDVTGEVTAAKPGPAVTLFEFKPAANVRVSKISDLCDDLAMALSSESLRIIAPIPGRDVVGIETSNAQRETVYHKDLLADEDFWKDDIKLPVALGKQANGDPKIVDLRKMPHLMVAGTTGSGKSVFTVSLITGLLFRHSPKTLKLILIDPKQVDLAAFDKVPHLALPMVGDSMQAVNALKWAVREMEKRYKSMSIFGAKGLEVYNETVARMTKEQIEEHDKINQEYETSPGKRRDQYYFQPLPYMVIVVEEFADLMSVDKNNVEQSVVRLAQKARACGIHLILCMQSPRKEVVTGLIKTNIPGRISFKVNSAVDSRIILDEMGGERLLAQGDMLFKSPGGSGLIRHHGPYLKDACINAVAKFWSDQGEPQYDPAAVKAMEGVSDGSSTDSIDGGLVGDGTQDYDEKYDEILAWAASLKEVSASLIQRRFQLGYPRAARIVETFEKEGVVGPSNGSKPRQVLVNDLSHLGK